MSLQTAIPDGYELSPGGVIVGKGAYTGRIIRRGEVIDEFECKNIVVNQGLNYMLNAALGNGAVITTWYVGLFSGNYTVLASDTASNIASASTEVSAYAAGARQAWTPVTATTQSITNAASQASFTFNGSVTVYGAFLVSTATISGTGGTLFSGAQFGSAKSVVATDILQLTYSYTAASA